MREKGSELWPAGMAVLDDLRDSTRLAAVGFMKVSIIQILNIRGIIPSMEYSTALSL